MFRRGCFPQARPDDRRRRRRQGSDGRPFPDQAVGRL